MGGRRGGRKKTALKGEVREWQKGRGSRSPWWKSEKLSVGRNSPELAQRKYEKGREKKWSRREGYTEFREVQKKSAIMNPSGGHEPNKEGYRGLV